MAYIKVDTGKIKSTAGKVDDGVKNIKKRMNKATSDVNEMSSSWSGKDYSSYKARWDTLTANGNEYSRMIKGLESYSAYLKYAARRYEQARNRAISEASLLRR